MGAENISTIWEGDSVGIWQCKKNFRRYSHFWRKAHSDYVIPQHDNWCNTSPMYVPQTVYQMQECLPKKHVWGLVPCHHQSPAPSQLEALKMPASIGYPGADGGAFQFYISGGWGFSSLSKRPSAVLSSWTTPNILVQWERVQFIIYHYWRTLNYGTHAYYNNLHARCSQE